MKFLIVILFALTTLAQQKTVYVAYIDSEIDLGLAPYISRVISEAEQNNADAIVFKINTFGGRVDAATQIKDAILSSKILTIAFINNRAISAGALIALSCNKIVMVPGSSIGAATVVDETGKKQVRNINLICARKCVLLQRRMEEEPTLLKVWLMKELLLKDYRTVQH